MSNNNNTPPPWSEAPPWAMWRAQDEDGEWWWFRLKPKQNRLGFWVTLPGSKFEQAKICGHNPNWRDTLQKRPENE